MKVIFLEDDRIAEVSDGHARNFLFPRRLAVPATGGALAEAETRQAKRKAEQEKYREQMKALAEKLSSLEITLAADAGEGGKLFGSVTAADIAAAAGDKAGMEIDKKKIELDEPLKNIGDYRVPLKLFQDISATLKIQIVAR